MAGWEWLDGNDLRYQNRDLLPQAFEQLGNFHLEQRHTGQVYSLVTHQPYATIKDLLEGELTFLTAFHDKSVRKEVARAFSLLEAGFTTYIHGDMHPGNLRITEQGLKFVDWGYCISSLSLFDLGYIHTVNFEDRADKAPWWCITPEEAQLVLPAYYAACGLGGHNYNQIHWAVMLWRELWAYYNSIQHENLFASEKCKQHIEQLIAMK